MYSFKKLTQFSQKNTVPCVSASDTNGFLLRDACVFQLSRNGLYGMNIVNLHLGDPKSQLVLISKTN
jgi:hypothetical protein